jgi:hypothetical protein
MGCKCRKNKARFKKQMVERRRLINEKREKDALDAELAEMTPRQKRIRLRKERAKKRRNRIEARKARIARRQEIAKRNKDSQEGSDNS